MSGRIRSDSEKAGELGRDLSLLGAACAFGFVLLRQVYPNMDPLIDSTGTAFIMSLGATVLRVLRSRERRRRAAQETDVERRRRG